MIDEFYWYMGKFADELVKILTSSNPENYHEAFNTVIEKILQFGKERREIDKEWVSVFKTAKEVYENNSIHTIHLKKHKVKHVFPVFPVRYYIDEKNPADFCPICKQYAKQYKIKSLTLSTLTNVEGSIYRLIRYADAETKRIVEYVFEHPDRIKHLLKILAEILDFPELAEYEKLYPLKIRYGDYELKVDKDWFGKIRLILYEGDSIVVSIKHNFIDIESAKHLKLIKEMIYSDLARLLV